MRSPWKRLARASAFLFPLAPLLLNGCIFGGEEKNRLPAPPTGPCVDVSGDTLLQANALVASANDAMVSNFQYWGDQEGNWDAIKRRNPQSAITLYDQALRIAPGHCQAIFGRAVASATLLTQDAKLDAFIKKVDNSAPLPGTSVGPGSGTEIGSMAALMKMPPDRAPAALAKLAGNLRQVDRPTVREAQVLIENVVMPKLDASIQAMEIVMDYSAFAIRYSVDGDSVEIDRSEVGPGLAGLKVMKAFLTVVAGYDWEFAVGGRYDWIDTLSRIRLDDFDHLRPAQTQALDRLTGLFAQGSAFSKYRDGWREKVQAIPDLLLEAVGDAQKGLQYTIDEAARNEGQEYDALRAGGRDADVDTVDLRIAIDALERTKKYLTGEALISYEKGTRTLIVDFPRLFRIDGLQSMLPYFRFLPYSQWNDTVESDTLWDGYSYMSYDALLEVYRAMGLGAREGGPGWELYATYSPGFADTGSISYYDFSGDTEDKQVALFWPDADDPCSFSFVRYFDMKGPATDAGIVWIPRETRGRFKIGLCRDVNGRAEFAELDVLTRGPLEFTDSSGAKTLAIQDLKNVDGPLDLAGKIVFRDPTFGGVFPEMTNAKLWEYVESIERVDSRTERTCGYEDGTGDWKCTRKLPDNPSDLDFILFALYWGDEIL